jgi:RimJ/RimL family protein N-acetyltransferase
MQDVPTELLTQRLRLRKPVLADAAPIFEAYASDPEVPRYLTWRVNTDVAQTRDYLERSLADRASGARFPYVIELLSEPSRPAGMVDARPTPRGVSFGYVLARRLWGQGYMTEALRPLVDWWLAQPGVFRCYAFCDVDNPASGRVMEKAGMSFEGVLRRYSVHPMTSDEPRDCRVYARVR